MTEGWERWERWAALGAFTNGLVKQSARCDGSVHGISITMLEGAANKNLSTPLSSLEYSTRA